MKLVLFRYRSFFRVVKGFTPSTSVLRRCGSFTVFHRLLTVWLVAAMILLSNPLILVAQVQGSGTAPSTGPYPAPVLTPTNVTVNRTVPKVIPPSSVLSYSANPTDAEIFSKSPFEEPLVPIDGSSTLAENKALTQALLTFSKRTVRDDYSALERFLAANPNSVWKISLLTDLGWCYRQTGWYSKAMDAWQQAWDAGSQAKINGNGKPMIDRALVELIVLNARVGRMDQLKALIPVADARALEGSSKEKVEGAKQALVLMQTRPQISFVCGPLAVEKLRNMTDGNAPEKLKMETFPSTQKGTSLVQLKADAKSLGMDYIAAHREVGAPVITPAVINWKLGHFATVLSKERGMYHIYDPTFSKDVWVSQSAIDSESSGYFLVKNQTLPSGWTAVTDEVAGTVWGKGTNAGCDPDDDGEPAPDGGDGGDTGGPGGPQDPNEPPPPGPPPPCPICPPVDNGYYPSGSSPESSYAMARYSVYESTTSLSVSDSPLFYTPAYGPAVNFKVTYAQREANQPSSFTYSNLGPLWTFNWLAYITDDPSNPGADVNHYLSGGGTLIYSGYNSSTETYAPQIQTGCVLKLTSSSSYELDIPDGSKQFFAAATATTPRKIFLTKTQDPMGNALTFTYDSNFRIVACTDSMGQVTTINYGNSNDIYKITSVKDPFGRTATFAYTSSGYLQSSTDVSGIVSSYGYTNQTLTSLTTPYGTTSFNVGQNTNDRWVQITDPEGAQERYETWNNYNYSTPASATVCPSGVDNQYLNLRNTFHWTKKQMQSGAGNYADCNIIHWCHETNISVMSDQIESFKHPLESRVYYNYAGQSSPSVMGSSGQPIRETRILDDGSTQETDAAYNSLNKVTSQTDAAGRVTQYVYAANNIDLLEIHQGTTLPGDLLVKYTYYPNHLVQTATDASGQTTSYTYTSQGQIQTITDPKSEVTTYTYFPSGASKGYLESVTGPQTGSTTSFTWDGLGRILSITDINGYTSTYNYDSLNRVTKVTYPDATFDQNVYTNLSLTQSKDRLGRWTRYFYNPNEQLIGILDSADRATSYDRCTCGELKGVTDPLGHRTSWAQDIEGRITTKTFFDNSTISIAYENNIGRPKTVTDTNGQVTTYTYNKDNSISNIAYTNSTVATASVGFAYDPLYLRATSMTDGTGTTTYTYNPVASGTLGSGRLGSETGPLGATAKIGYTYDQLGRITALSVNGVSSSVGYDSLGRPNTATNPLGTFTYNYVGITPRLQSVTSTNGPTTDYSYLTANQDVRLGEIKNLTHGNVPLSKFDYTYNPVGTITTWQQQQDSGTATSWAFSYDGADQLISAVRANTSTQAVISDYVYQYDLAGNRTSEQIGQNVKTTSYNSLNQITGTSGAGMMQFTGTLSEPATVTVGGNPASVDASNNFKGFAAVTNGTNTVQIVAKDYSNNASTNTYQIVQPVDTASTVAYDSLGNMTNNGSGQTYAWDAKNELTSITYSTPIQEKLVGSIVGTSGSNNNSGTVIANAFDGNSATYFDGPTANGCWLGLDMGVGNQAPVSQVKFTCRNTYGSRMVGGQFQTSTDPTFATGVTTLGTISTAPANGVSTIMTFTGAAAKRYVRYLSPNSSYGDIAELEFDATINSTAFAYDGLSRRVKITEQNSSGNAVITKQHLWIGNTITEERDGSDNVVKRFYAQGLQLNGSNYFYTRDHLCSVRELVDSSGNIQARYDYDPYGRVIKIQGSTVLDADFQYANYYEHQNSGLNLTKYRAYDPNTGKWISRDPIAEAGTNNLYQYCLNNPVSNFDLGGLTPIVAGTAPPSIPPDTAMTGVSHPYDSGATNSSPQALPPQPSSAAFDPDSPANNNNISASVSGSQTAQGTTVSGNMNIASGPYSGSVSESASNNSGGTTATTSASAAYSFNGGRYGPQGSINATGTAVTGPNGTKLTGSISCSLKF